MKTFTSHTLPMKNLASLTRILVMGEGEGEGGIFRLETEVATPDVGEQKATF